MRGCGADGAIALSDAAVAPDEPIRRAASQAHGTGGLASQNIGVSLQKIYETSLTAHMLSSRKN